MGVPVGYEARPRLERFSEKWTPEPNTGCWLWTSAVNNRGYGMFSVLNHPRLAHRISYELHVGPIPTGMHILHCCDNGAIGCVNPAHLRVGTPAENSNDMAKRGRAWQRRLTPESVRQIRSLIGVVGLQRIANKFGVTKRAIQFIKRRKNWKHVA